MENEREIQKNKTSNRGMIIALVVCIIIIIGLAGYICYDKVLLDNKTTQDDSKLSKNTKDTNTTKEEDNQEEQKEETTTQMSNTQKCTGTYYGEASGNLSNGLSYDYKYTYTLKEDGTFDMLVNNASGTSGVYVITGNTISLIGGKHTTGPIDEDPQYSTVDYVIASDCSYILVDDSNEISFKAMRQ